MTKNNTDPAGLSSSPRYRVIADRDRGDDPTTDNIFEGDRYTMQANPGPTFTDQVVRIERPVPTTDEPQQDGPLMRGLEQSRRGETVDLGSFAQYAERPPLPTREQIAEALYLDDADHEDWSWATEDSLLTRAAYLKNVDAVLALFQKGADR